ncbi:hypothetical protein HPP92_026507 [Vanilla planifolia]|uniref:Uncharacterized protein n=1 Tax=Vanilla planifolia TaxID=51239 RepID=A0A835PD77_VANPL|nr:hypothetical protein HPP92_026507 [Vanilla planifolia]
MTASDTLSCDLLSCLEGRRRSDLRDAYGSPGLKWAKGSAGRRNSSRLCEDQAQGSPFAHRQRANAVSRSGRSIGLGGFSPGPFQNLF